MKSTWGLLLFVMLLGLCVPSLAEKPPAAIVVSKGGTFCERLAAHEIHRYVYLRTGQLLDVVNDLPPAGDAIVVRTSAGDLDPQAYSLMTWQDGRRRILEITGGSDSATLYGAYRFAELLGVRFYMHGDVVPDERVKFKLPILSEQAKPLFELRGIQPFHDFPEGPDWWNTDQYKAILSQLPKMGMNFFGLHTYPEDRPAAEPTVWIGMPSWMAC